MISTPSRTLFALPYWIAEHRGYFRDEGVAPSLEIVGSSDTIRERLRSGETRLAIDAADGVLLDALNGGPLRIAAGNTQRPPLFLVARADFKELSELRGATFGALSLKEGSSKLIPKIVATAGLSPSDYRIVEAGGAPARAQLLREKKIDAALQPMPLHYEAEAEGFNVLAWAGTYEPEWQFNTLNINIDLTHLDPRPIVAILRAMLRGLKTMQEDPDEAAKIGALELGADLPVVMRAVADAVKLDIFNPSFECSEAGLSRIFRNMQADGTIDANETFRMDRFVEQEFLYQAQGWQPDTKL